MPKLKTRKAAAKRFRATGSGKIFRRKAFKNHMLYHKSSEQKRRRLSNISLVSEQDDKEVRLMLPYL
jgi:large subunit ribosomal protein L35